MQIKAVVASFVEPIELVLDIATLPPGCYSFGVHWVDGKYQIGDQDGSVCAHPITVTISPKSTQED